MKYLTLLSKREKTLLAGGLLIVVITLGTTYIYMPLQAKIQEKETVLHEKRTRLAELTPWRATPGLLDRTLEEKEKRYSQLALEMPSQPEMDWFLIRLEGEVEGQVVGIARLAGVSVDKFEPVKPQEGKNAKNKGSEAKSAPKSFQSLDVKMELSGSYSQIIDFLSRLDQLPRLQKVTNLELELSKAKEAAPGFLEAKMVVQFYLGPAGGAAARDKIQMPMMIGTRDPFLP